MLKAKFIFYKLKFNKPSGTSRGILYDKPTWYIKIWHKNNKDVYGIGECSPIPGLSLDSIENIDSILREVCDNINNLEVVNLLLFPCIQFGIEMALLDLQNNGNRILFNNNFSNELSSLKINGLIWMSDKNNMLRQIETKINDGFTCLKLKIGAIDFNDELFLLETIRSKFPLNKLEIRLDANGAFSSEEALEKIQELSIYDIHSIEQPIKQGQLDKMKYLCKASQIDIALDEELISVIDNKKRKQLLEYIKPKYIILKPSLLGGFAQSKIWINIAEELNISWWFTSALESNIGLNAISQFAAEFSNKLPSGLGTGNIYFNNIPSFLQLKADEIYINKKLRWDYSNLDNFI
jgi:o-succinylbenzoate synthase